MTHRRAFDEARRALMEALGPELAAEFQLNVPDVLDETAALVAGGYTTIEHAASALCHLDELADATERGEITADEGCALVLVHALADRDGREPD